MEFQRIDTNDGKIMGASESRRDILNHDFHEPHRRNAGYDRLEVDTYLDVLIKDYGITQDAYNSVVDELNFQKRENAQKDETIKFLRDEINFQLKLINERLVKSSVSTPAPQEPDVPTPNETTIVDTSTASAVSYNHDAPIMTHPEKPIEFVNKIKPIILYPSIKTHTKEV